MHSSKIILPLFWICISLLHINHYSYAQSYLKGNYVVNEATYEGATFTVYTFSRRKGKVKAKYFAQNAHQGYKNWKQKKKILFYCSGAFSETWDPGAVPKGICVDNGKIVNRSIDHTMDGLVIVYNGGAQQGGIAVINIDKEKVKVNQGGSAEYDLRNSSEKNQFLNWADREGATVFQTQLMYSKEFKYGFPLNKATYGKSAERRFLAICMKNGVVYHIVVDHPSSDYLNNSALRITGYLKDKLGYTVYGLFNLDTGGKNIMKAFDDKGYEIAKKPLDIKEATNLLIYYVD
jgi:hypothetical protein